MCVTEGSMKIFLGPGKVYSYFLEREIDHRKNLFSSCLAASVLKSSYIYLGKEWFLLLVLKIPIKGKSNILLMSNCYLKNITLLKTKKAFDR